MARKITHKQVQVIHACSCGHTSVDHETFPIRFADLKKAGIKRKKDKNTGSWFFVQFNNYECTGNSHNEY